MTVVKSLKKVAVCASLATFSHPYESRRVVIRRKVRRRALEMQWPEKDGPGIAQALVDLEDALCLHACILDGVVNPASVWPDLEREPEADAIALERAADDVTARAVELSRVLPAS
jgi:hypothetical protein